MFFVGYNLKQLRSVINGKPSLKYNAFEGSIKIKRFSLFYIIKKVIKLRMTANEYSLT